MKHFYIKTYGCQMNVRDSEAVAELLAEQGYFQVQKEEEADIILFNTCSVRDNAERKAMGKIGHLKKLMKEKPDLIIGVMGCMAQSKGYEITNTHDHVSFVVGTDQLHKLPEIVAKIESGTSREVVETAIGDEEVMDALVKHRAGDISAFVSIMRGCNNFCAYCIVPYTRGREKSKTVESVVSEVKELAAKGIKEVNLLGQNVNAYGIFEARKAKTYVEGTSIFADLLKAVHEIDGIERIRFTSPHPRYFTDDFIEAIGTLPKVCESFHIPLQSGSNRILKSMKRGYTAEEFLIWVGKIREVMPTVCFSTDVIVGFPGETEEDFEETRRVFKASGFDMAYIFEYSPRKDTPAATMPHQVDAETKDRRLKTLLQDLEDMTSESNKVFLGQTLEIMVEGPSKRNPARWAGRARNFKNVIFVPETELEPGDFVNVKIERVTAATLFGPNCKL